MLKIKYFIKGESDTSTIHIRFTDGRKFDFKRSTSYQIATKHWDSKNEKLRNISTIENRETITTYLEELKPFLRKTFLNDYREGVEINSKWLKGAVERFSDQNKSDLNLLTEYFEYFIRNLPNRLNQSRGGVLGVSRRTELKYKSVLNKLKDFELYRNARIRVVDVNLKFRGELIKYLQEIDRQSYNSIGKIISILKTVCNDAKTYPVKTHPELTNIKGFERRADFIYLNEIMPGIGS